MPLYDQNIRGSPQALTTYPDNPISVSSYRVNPIAQYALGTHLDTSRLFAQPEGNLSSDNQPFLPLSPVMEPPSTVPTKTQSTRPSNAFMLFRSEFVKQHKSVGRRQQELSVMAGCAWRALGTEGQTGWYEKAALAKGQYDSTNTGLNATSQRPKPYRPRINARDVAYTDAMRPVRETYATLSPARRRVRKSVNQPISLPTLSVQDPVPIVRNSNLVSSSTLAHALHPPSFFAGHHNRADEANISPISSTQSDESYGGSNLQLLTSTIEMGHSNYIVSGISTADSAAPSSPYDSFSPQVPTQYPSPVSPSDWNNGFIESHYNLPSALTTTGASYRHVGLYDENNSRQDHFHTHANFF